MLSLLMEKFVLPAFPRTLLSAPSPEMAEALAAVRVVATLLQLIDFSGKVLACLNSSV